MKIDTFVDMLSIITNNLWLYAFKWFTKKCNTHILYVYMSFMI